MAGNPDSQFIFLDLRGRRWPLFRRVAFWCALLLAVAGVLFLTAVWIRPELRLPAMVRELKGHLKAGVPTALAPDPKAADWRRYFEQSRAGQERLAKLRGVPRASTKGEAPGGDENLRLTILSCESRWRRCGRRPTIRTL